MTPAEQWLAHMHAEVHWANGQVFVTAGRFWGVGRDLDGAVRNAQEREAATWRRAPALAECEEAN